MNIFTLINLSIHYDNVECFKYYVSKTRIDTSHMLYKPKIQKYLVMLMFLLEYEYEDDSYFNDNFTKQRLCELNLLKLVFDYI